MGYPITPDPDTVERPQQVHVHVHLPCNLRCVQCDIWQLRNPPSELTLEERLDLLRQLAVWHPGIRVSWSGGEIIARRRVLYPLIEEAGRLGLANGFASNGTLLKDSDFERLPSSGLSGMVFSIDHHDPAVHDRIRGVPGTHAKVMASLERMSKARHAAGSSMVVGAAVILCRENLDSIEELVCTLVERGADQVGLNAVAPVLARPMDASWSSLPPLFPDDPAQIDRGIDTLIRLKQQGAPLKQECYQFEDMRAYFHKPRELAAGHCSSWWRNLVVGVFGEVGLCFNQSDAGVSTIGNIRTTPIAEIWDSATMRQGRRVLAACRRSCGALGCHAR